MASNVGAPPSAGAVDASNDVPINPRYRAPMDIKAIAAVAGSVVFALGASGCTSESVVDKDALAKEVSTQLASGVGHAPESVTCPEDLSGKVGATTTCTLSDSGESYGVAVTVKSVEGSDVKFDIKVADEPK
jgi:hypothetical protein